MAANISDEQRAQILRMVSECGGNKTRAAEVLGHSRSTVIDACRSVGYGIGKTTAIAGKIVNLCKRPNGATEDELAAVTGVDRGDLSPWIDDLVEDGRNLQRLGDRWHLILDPQSAFSAGNITEYVSRPDGTYVFGALGDSHLGSKYERLDALNELYATFVDEGCDRVYHTGNWIDGEASFNKHELHTHGMDAQCRYLAKVYPSYPGLTTYAVAGDDHEGWYAQRDGIDIGRFAESIMHQEGRSDWVNLGYLEACVKLTHYQTGVSTILAVCHPGGGTAYAVSYTVQKLVEAFGGGEKPAVALAGHFHKLEFIPIRNVYCCQTGCTIDQTSWARKKRIQFQLGGFVITLHQDPVTGAITRAKADLTQFFNKAFYNGRWGHGQPLTQPELTRSA